MSNLEIFPYLSSLAERMDWRAKEVLRDIDGIPHLLNRIELSGPRFEHRALVPVVTVGRVRSRTVEISADGLTAKAYFDRPMPDDGVVTFGYEDGALYRFPRRFDLQLLEVLDRKKLPESVRFPSLEGPGLEGPGLERPRSPNEP